MGRESIAAYHSPFATRLRRGIEIKCKNEDEKESKIVGELATYLGATRQAVSQYRNGTVAPNIEKLVSIAEYFKVSTDWLLGLTEIQSGNSDDMAIEKRLGLTNNAISNLENKPIGIPQYEWDEYLHTANKFIGNSEFFSLILKANDYYKARKERLDKAILNRLTEKTKLNPDELADLREYQLQKQFIEIINAMEVTDNAKT